MSPDLSALAALAMPPSTARRVARRVSKRCTLNFLERAMSAMSRASASHALSFPLQPS